MLLQGMKDVECVTTDTFVPEGPAAELARRCGRAVELRARLWGSPQKDKMASRGSSREAAFMSRVDNQRPVRRLAQQDLDRLAKMD